MSPSWAPGEMASRLPPPHLRAHVPGVTGYREDTQPLRRREVPSGSITLIISFGQPLRLLDAPGPLRHAGTYTSFVAGLHEGPALIEHDGKQHGIEVNLTPVGTHAFFGVSMHELTNTIVDLHDLSTATSGPLPASLQWSSWAPSCPMDAAHPGPELSPGS